MSTSDKVVYEIIGDPKREWGRRVKQVDMIKEELMEEEWKEMQEEKKQKENVMGSKYT